LLLAKGAMEKRKYDERSAEYPLNAISLCPGNSLRPEEEEDDQHGKGDSEILAGILLYIFLLTHLAT
jgi:hypothetical protein